MAPQISPATKAKQQVRLPSPNKNFLPQAFGNILQNILLYITLLLQKLNTSLKQSYTNITRKYITTIYLFN
jgi:hypothetical protein